MTSKTILSTSAACLGLALANCGQDSAAGDNPAGQGADQLPGSGSSGSSGTGAQNGDGGGVGQGDGGGVVVSDDGTVGTYVVPELPDIWNKVFFDETPKVSVPVRNGKPVIDYWDAFMSIREKLPAGQEQRYFELGNTLLNYKSLKNGVERWNDPPYANGQVSPVPPRPDRLLEQRRQHVPRRRAAARHPRRQRQVAWHLFHLRPPGAPSASRRR